jgi:protein phosphatase
VVSTNDNTKTTSPDDGEAGTLTDVTAAVASSDESETAATEETETPDSVDALEESPAPSDVPSVPFEEEPTREETVDTVVGIRQAVDTVLGVGAAFRVAHSVRTHTGLVRDHNEDDYFLDEELGVYLVADGMGGHAAGKVASSICVKTVERFFVDQLGLSESDSDNGLSEFAEDFAKSLRYANRQIYEASLKDGSLEGMGTTAVGIRIMGTMAAVCHAGDSRCYLLREGRFEQVTADHSLSNFLMSMGREMEARLAEATMSNVIMRALGLELDLTVDAQEFELQAGDRLMLCSDGLSDLVPLARLERMITDESLDLDSLTEEMVRAALDAGGRDNITVLVVDLLESLVEDDADDLGEPTIKSLDDTLERMPGYRKPK